MMFHDDDAVPDIDTKSSKQVLLEAKALKKRLDNEGLVAEMVAPRLWFAPQTIDGGYTSNDPKLRRYAIDRSRQSIDIANELGTDILVLWLARDAAYTPALSCAPCFERECPLGHTRCLNDIRPERVRQALGM